MTSAPVIDTRAHFAAIKALLDVTLGMEPSTGKSRVYDYGTVPGADGNAGTLPTIYALVSIERRYVGPRRAGLAGRSGWRVSVRYVGRTVAEARWAENAVTQALDEVRLYLGASPIASTPITHESTSAIEPDDGRFSGLTVWTYAL